MAQWLNISLKIKTWKSLKIHGGMEKAYWYWFMA